MILTDEQIKADDEKWKCRDVKQELKYIGYATTTRTSVTNDDIKFVACMARKALSTITALEAEQVRCKDCKHFETDVVEVIDGIPLIVAHEMCNKWGGGCKTSENGYCFMAERREKEVTE